MEEQEIDVDLDAQAVILAAAQHDVQKLRSLLPSTSANVQDAETGATPLHAAIAALEPEATEPANGDAAANGVTANGDDAEPKDELQDAARTVKLLLQNGAIWNDLDKNNETPGCIAFRLGLTGLYELMVDAGVRAEMLLNRMDEYEPIPDQEDEEAEATEGFAEISAEEAHEAPHTGPENPGVNSEDFLRSHLTFDEDRILDADGNSVMMAWESGIMRRSAELLAPGEGLRVLNVGHGMGIVDDFFQSRSPVCHHIIEAHPAVLEQLRAKGWHEKPGVVIHDGRWQEIVPQLLADNVLFDAIYFDTFAEDYKALRDFFSEYVIGLLDAQGGVDGQGGRWGFFNGLGADRQVCYDVYGKLVEMDLFEAGFDTEWEEVSVPELDANETWAGVRQKYWTPKTYRLPTCRFIE